MSGTTMTVEFVKDLPGWGAGEACLVRAGEQHYVVSSVVAMFSGFETLVFKSDAEGECDSFLDVAGGKGMSRAEAIKDLGVRLAEGDE